MTSFGTIEQAFEDLRHGKVVIVADDEDRENEGDLVCAAELATPEMINFMTLHGRGLICLSMTRQRVEDRGVDDVARVQDDVGSGQRPRQALDESLAPARRASSSVIEPAGTC